MEMNSCVPEVHEEPNNVSFSYQKVGRSLDHDVIVENSELGSRRLERVFQNLKEKERELQVHIENISNFSSPCLNAKYSLKGDKLHDLSVDSNSSHTILEDFECEKILQRMKKTLREILFGVHQLNHIECKTHKTQSDLRQKHDTRNREYQSPKPVAESDISKSLERSQENTCKFSTTRRKRKKISLNDTQIEAINKSIGHLRDIMTNRKAVLKNNSLQRVKKKRHSYPLSSTHPRGKVSSNIQSESVKHCEKAQKEPNPNQKQYVNGEKKTKDRVPKIEKPSSANVKQPRNNQAKRHSMHVYRRQKGSSAVHSASSNERNPLEKSKQQHSEVNETHINRDPPSSCEEQHIVGIDGGSKEIEKKGQEIKEDTSREKGLVHFLNNNNHLSSPPPIPSSLHHSGNIVVERNAGVNIEETPGKPIIDKDDEKISDISGDENSDICIDDNLLDNLLY